MKIKKIFAAFLCAVMLSSCDLVGINGTSCTGGNCSTGTIDIDGINKYLSTASDDLAQNMLSVGGKTVLIPFTHINGPKDEWQFFAIVNFQYHFSKFSRYQITYLSCTCRSGEVNYWQTMFLELNTPKSGALDDVTVRTISFEKDSTGDYYGGFWGDSGMEFDSVDNMNGVTYYEIRDAFIPYLIGKSYADLSGASVTKTTYDAGGNEFIGLDEADFDSYASSNNVLVKGATASLSSFVGASVSTDNILRIIKAAMKYHATIM